MCRKKHNLNRLFSNSAAPSPNSGSTSSSNKGVIIAESVGGAVALGLFLLCTILGLFAWRARKGRRDRLARTLGAMSYDLEPMPSFESSQTGKDSRNEGLYYRPVAPKMVANWAFGFLA